MRNNPIFKNTEIGDNFYNINIEVIDKDQTDITLDIRYNGENNTSWSNVIKLTETAFNSIFNDGGRS